MSHLQYWAVKSPDGGYVSIGNNSASAWSRAEIITDCDWEELDEDGYVCVRVELKMVGM